jgi:hypothetical protein
MPKLPQRLPGNFLKIKDRSVPFSFWPTYESGRRDGIQSSLFTVNPWGLLEKQCETITNISSKSEAFACLSQAKYFFETGEGAHLFAAKPLMFYYSFLNLVKTYGLILQYQPTYSDARHGINDPGTWTTFDNLTFNIYSSPDRRTRKLNLASEFMHGIENTIPTSIHLSIPITSLLPQFVIGHRIWCEIADDDERFVSVEKIDYMINSSNNTVWLRIKVFEDDLKRLNVSHSAFLVQSGLSTDYRKVKPSKIGKRKLLVFEQKNPTHFTHRASDILSDLSLSIKKYLWVVVRDVPPYRRYYLYNCPPTQTTFRLPQETSVHFLMYLLSNITRYSPEKFNEIIKGQHGAFVSEFISSCPRQFLYLITSNILKREISLPAIV